MSTDAARLLEFVRAAKARQVDDEFILALLRQNGWSERRVYAVFTAYYEEALGAPVPSRGSRAEHAREAFYYLLVFITLGTWSFALGSLFYDLIDRWLRDPVAQTSVEPFRSAVSLQLASMIVAFPIFLYVSSSIAREVARRPETLDSGVRKWLTYLALVIAAAVLVSDAVWFLQQFLSGELTTRFVLHAIVLLVIAGGIFWYYLGTVGTEAPSAARGRYFAWGAATAIAAGLILGFFDIGSPVHQRAIGADERRVQDLRLIAGSINALWRESSPKSSFVLPRRIEDVVPAGATRTDPITLHRYEYRPLGGTRYELCAVFETAGDDARDPGWKHTPGRVCFQRNAAVGN
jgi:hypothetical protein